MKKSILAPIITIISLLMILAMIAVLFLPYFNTTIDVKDENGKRQKVDTQISINDFVWFPREYKDLQESFEDQYDIEFDDYINEEITMPAVTLVLGAVLIVFSLLKMKSVRGCVSAMCLGLYGYLAYSTSWFWCVGINWVTNMYICLAAAIVGALGVAYFVLDYVLSKKREAKQVASAQ